MIKLKIENEVTGKIVVKNPTYIRVEIYLRGEKIDRFGIYLNEESVEDYLEHNTDKFLGVKNTYEGYAQLVKDLGLEIPESYKKHWKPKINEEYVFINSYSELENHLITENKYRWLDEKRIENYNAFPPKELAEKAVNLSKLGRLIFLWQYANECIFYPDWKNDYQYKWGIRYGAIDEVFRCEHTVQYFGDTMYFETREQAETFIKMYSEEIKEIMGVK